MVSSRIMSACLFVSSMRICVSRSPLDVGVCFHRFVRVSILLLQVVEYFVVLFFRRARGIRDDRLMQRKRARLRVVVVFL